MGVLFRRRIVLLRVVLFSFLLLLVSPVAHADKRVALVIGNSSYRPPAQLANPRNDASDIAAAMRMHGFRVIVGLDLDKAAMDAKLREFESELRGAETGVFFYAGHALQVSGQNYMLPVDAELRVESALEVETVSLDQVQRTMQRAVPTKILFLDACRTNPFARNLQQAMGTRSIQVGRGLAPIRSGVDTLISFSTEPDTVALDGNGRNSPFTGALVRRMRSIEREDLNGLLIAVRNDVMGETQGRQVPWEHSALTKAFYFKAEANPTPPPYIANPVLPAPVRPQANLSAPVRPQPNQAERARALVVAKELVAAKGGNALYGPIVPGIIEEAKRRFLQANPMLGKDLNEVAAKLRAEYAARTAEILDDHAELYAAQFEEQELKDALAFYKSPLGRKQLVGVPDQSIAFYKSPLGRKLLAEEPRILDENMGHAQSWADRLAEEIIRKMRAEMKKRGHDI